MKRGMTLIDLVHDLDGVGARLALDGEHDGALAVEIAGGIEILVGIHGAADILHPHRRAIAEGDDLLVPMRGVGSWPLT